MLDRRSPRGRQPLGRGRSIRALANERTPPVSVEEHAVLRSPGVGLLATRLVDTLSDDRSLRTGAQPKQWCDSCKRHVHFDLCRIEIRQLKELDVLLQA